MLRAAPVLARRCSAYRQGEWHDNATYLAQGSNLTRDAGNRRPPEHQRPRFGRGVLDLVVGTEAGTFVTDGNLDGMGNAPSARYTFADVTITASQVPSLVGDSLSNGGLTLGVQPTNGFDWNGSAPTLWFHSSGF